MSQAHSCIPAADQTAAVFTEAGYSATGPQQQGKGGTASVVAFRQAAAHTQAGHAGTGHGTAGQQQHSITEQGA